MPNSNVASPPPPERGQAASQSTDGPRSNGGLSWLAALRSRLGLGPQQTLRETLEEAVRSEASGDATFSVTERDMLLRLLRFGALSVEDVMVPRADIIAIDQSATVGELMHLFEEAGVSRIPVYHETLDDPRGMVHVKDLLRYLGRPGGEVRAAGPAPAETAPSKPASPRLCGDLDRTIGTTDLLRPVLNVPPSMPAVNLLIRMQTTRHHIALVVDEYGGTDGLVTIEDLIEQVVGDIEDEYDIEEAANIVEDARLGIVAQARTPIDELEAHLGVKLLKPEDESEIDTVGGLVVMQLGRVPVKGELVTLESGIEIEVLEADPRRIKRLRIHRPLPLAAAGASAVEAGDGIAATADPAVAPARAEPEPDRRE